MFPEGGPRSDSASSLLVHPTLSIKTSLSLSLNNGTDKGGCSDSHAHSNQVECSVPAIYIARALRMFLRMHAFKARALFLSFFVFIVRSIEASLREVILSLFFQHRHHLILLFLSSLPSSASTAIIHLRSIYIAKRWTVYRRRTLRRGNLERNG